MRIFGLFALLAMVSACTPTVTADTLRFNKGIELGTGKTFAIVAANNQGNNLEFNHYAELVNRQLQANGLKQAASLNAADYRVTFNYGTSRGTRVINNYSDYGLYGGVGSYGSSVGVGGTFYPPRSYRSEAYTLFDHTFEMQIAHANQRGMPLVFQGRVTDENDNSSIANTMPCMVAAMFHNFPGADGVEQRISLPTASCR